MSRPPARIVRTTTSVPHSQEQLGKAPPPSSIFTSVAASMLKRVRMSSLPSNWQALESARADSVAAGLVVLSELAPAGADSSLLQATSRLQDTSSGRSRVMRMGVDLGRKGKERADAHAGTR